MKMMHKSGQKNRKALRKNNRGLSLIELLVAMTILTFFSVVIYRGILVAVKTNAKADIQYKATSLAQNTMEGMKATRLNALLEQVYAPKYKADGDDAGTPTAVTFLSGANLDSNTKVGFFKDNQVIGEGNTIVDYTKATDNCYYMYVANALMEGRYFDILVKLDGSQYSVDDTTADIGAWTYNTSTLVAIPDMNSTYDAIFNDSLQLDGEALKEYKEINKTKPVEERVDEGDILLSDRTIEVTLDSKNTWGGTMSYEEAVYTYHATGFVEPASYTITQSKEKLRNVFIFFRPTYGTDTIIINNPKDLEVNIYLIKVDSSDASFNTDSQMKLDVYLNESNNGTDVPACASIQTNLPIPTNKDTYEPDLAKGNIHFYRGVPTDLPNRKPGNYKNFALNNVTGDYNSDVIMDASVYVYQSTEAQTQLDDDKFYGDYTWDQVMNATSGEIGSSDTNTMATMEGTIRN